MLNPQEKFVAVSFTRAHIADKLNCFLERENRPERLSLNDARLTGEICSEWAESTPTNWEDPASLHRDYDANIAALLAMGIEIEPD